MRVATVDAVIVEARRRNASDVMLRGGDAVAYIIAKRLIVDGDITVSEEAIKEFLGKHGVAEQSPASRKLRQHGYVVIDASDEVGTMRITITRPGGRHDVSIRLHGSEPPALETLGWPAAVEEIAAQPSGLVIITGPGGVGKTTLLNAFVRRHLERGNVAVWMLESPIEFRQAPRRGRITQFAVGGSGTGDIQNYAHGVVAAMTVPADVLAIGEAKDADVAQAAVDAARLGRKVYMTMHAGNTPQALEQLTVWGIQRGLLAQVVSAVLALRLVPKLGGGWAPAAEVWLPDDASLALVRDPQVDFDELRGQLHQRNGSQTLEAALRQLVRRGEITAEDARRYAVKAGEVAP